MREDEALAHGYRPAHGRSCRVDGDGGKSGTASHVSAEKPVSIRCGIERWPVKILGDPDRARVSFTPVDTTIHELGSRSRPRHRLPDNHRLGVEELTTYRVRAVLVRIKTEPDSDVHLMLA